MLNVTLDMNCIIDLEEGSEWAPHIRKLVLAHQEKKINLRLVAISASERKPNDTHAHHFDEFEEKIRAVGLGDIEMLHTQAYLGLAFLGHCVQAGEKTRELEQHIHEVLFPEIEFEYRDYCEKQHIARGAGEMDKKWRRAKCDVLGLWSHILYNGNIFVTRDENFHAQSKQKLIILGAGDILRPEEAAARIEMLS